MLCAVDNHNYMCHICATELLDLNLNEVVIDNTSLFMKLPQISYTHKNRNFKKYNWK